MSSTVSAKATTTNAAAAASSSAAAAATAAAKSLRQWNNEMTAAYFAISMLSLVALFSLIHGLNLLLVSRSSKNDGPFKRRIVSFSR